MKVLLDYHCPFSFVHGGFHVQIEQTFQALRVIGVDVEWLRFWDYSQRADIVHFFGKPHSSYLAFARTRGIRTVFNELHTNLGSRPAWQQFLQARLIRRLKVTCPPIAQRMDWARFQEADAILALTPYEASLIQNIFHAPAKRIHVLSNGVEDLFLERTALAREDWLLCVASIHPRKRVLELASAAIGARIPLRVCGAIDSKEDPYCKAFLRIVEDSDGLVRWEGNVTDRKTLVALYRRARGFVLPSVCETLSLSALEAAATGCPLLLSKLPWATTTFGDHASYISPKLTGTALGKKLTDFVKDPRPSGGFRVQSWTEVAQSLKRIYESLLVSKE